MMSGKYQLRRDGGVQHRDGPDAVPEGIVRRVDGVDDLPRSHRGIPDGTGVDDDRVQSARRSDIADGAVAPRSVIAAIGVVRKLDPGREGAVRNPGLDGAPGGIRHGHLADGGVAVIVMIVEDVSAKAEGRGARPGDVAGEIHAELESCDEKAAGNLPRGGDVPDISVGVEAAGGDGVALPGGIRSDGGHSAEVAIRQEFAGGDGGARRVRSHLAETGVGNKGGAGDAPIRVGRGAGLGCRRCRSRCHRSQFR